jgi:hypothetical protein
MKHYWIIVNGQPVGPLTADEVRAHAEFRPELPIWHAELPQWATVADLPEFAAPAVTVEEEATQQQPLAPAPPVPQPTAEPAPSAWINPAVNMPNSLANRPKGYMGWNIAATIACCLPTGIAGIIFAAKANSRWMQGDTEGAERAAERAQWCLILSIVLGLVSWPFQAIIQSLVPAMML